MVGGEGAVVSCGNAFFGTHARRVGDEIGCRVRVYVRFVTETTPVGVIGPSVRCVAVKEEIVAGIHDAVTAVHDADWQLLQVVDAGRGVGFGQHLAAVAEQGERSGGYRRGHAHSREILIRDLIDTRFRNGEAIPLAGIQHRLGCIRPARLAGSGTPTLHGNCDCDDSAVLPHPDLNDGYKGEHKIWLVSFKCGNSLHFQLFLMKISRYQRSIVRAHGLELHIRDGNIVGIIVERHLDGFVIGREGGKLTGIGGPVKVQEFHGEVLAVMVYDVVRPV